MENTIQFTRIKNDVNGNPRYVCHFLALMTREELDRNGGDWIPTGDKYKIAVKRANSIGGRKYHTKSYGGGIVFQSYSLAQEVEDINRVTGREYTGFTLD